MAALNRLLKSVAAAAYLACSVRRGLLTLASEADVRFSASLVRSTVRSRRDPKNRNVQWVFLGCPGVGKGTYASRLSQLLGVPHIATDDLVREELSSSGPLAQQKANMEAAYKNLIQEFCQKRHIQLPQYKVRKLGLDHLPRFCTQVEVDNVGYIGSEESSKRKAEQSTAKLVVDRLLSPYNSDQEITDLEKENQDLKNENAAIVEQCNKIQEELNTIREQKDSLWWENSMMKLVLQEHANELEEIGESDGGDFVMTSGTVAGASDSEEITGGAVVTESEDEPSTPVAVPVPRSFSLSERKAVANPDA